MIKTIYEDDHYIVIDKPANMAVHRSKLCRDPVTLVDLFREAGYDVFHPVHRLDRPTSGLMVVAKNPNACQLMQEQFTQRQVEKSYFALVRGWTDDCGIIDKPMTKEANSKKEKVEATTKYETVAKYELPYSDGRFPTSRFSLVKIDLITGRMHQIRRHFASISHHLVADRVYGKGIQNRIFLENFGTSSLLLSCTNLELTHPFLDKKISLQTGLSAGFQDTLTKIECYKV